MRPIKEKKLKLHNKYCNKRGNNIKKKEKRKNIKSKYKSTNDKQ